MSSDYERELLRILEDDFGWLAVRSAGSMGKGDIVAIHPKHENSPVVIEVKKTGENAFYTEMRKKSREKQFPMMQEHARRGINTCYAVRFTRGDEETRWQIYWVTGKEEKGQYRRGEGDTLSDTFNKQ